jgi:hypothetical protein
MHQIIELTCMLGAVWIAADEEVAAAQIDVPSTQNISRK